MGWLPQRQYEALTPCRFAHADATIYRLRGTIARAYLNRDRTNTTFQLSK